MSESRKSRSRLRAFQRFRLRAAVVGLFVLTGLLSLRFTLSAVRHLPPEPAGTELALNPVLSPDAATLVGVRPEERRIEEGGPVVPRLRLVEVTVPDDPFRPSSAEAPAARRSDPSRGGSDAVPQTDEGAGPGGRITAPGTAKETGNGGTEKAGSETTRQPAPARKPRGEDLVLTGIIQGEPPLAVVRYDGQSLFLKVGDRVADTWRLAEIRERSALFQSAEQRIEVQITRGGSQ